MRLAKNSWDPIFRKVIYRNDPWTLYTARRAHVTELDHSRPSDRPRPTPTLEDLRPRTPAAARLPEHIVSARSPALCDVPLPAIGGALAPLARTSSADASYQIPELDEFADNYFQSLRHDALLKLVLLQVSALQKDQSKRYV